MNSPYYKRFKVSQKYKGNEHDGLDLVGIDSKEIHATCNGIVKYAGWENENNHSQGFGKYVMIKEDNTNRYFYFGHLSEIKVKYNEHVKITDVIGIEGSTGYSTGSHCHYCCRIDGIKGKHLNINEISGIPNREWEIFDDGYRINENKTIKYTVKSGDTLINIAQKYNKDYMKIAKDNNIKNPDLIYVGQILEIK